MERADLVAAVLEEVKKQGSIEDGDIGVAVAIEIADEKRMR